MSAPIATTQVQPTIIQGGMGVAVSGWRLARAVSLEGQLGVVSGTGIDAVMVRRLQMGDPDGDLRRAFDAFPLPQVAARVWNRYFIAGGKQPGKPFRAKPIFTFPLTQTVTELVVLANFVEVFLAKEGHSGLLGINLLEKIQIATLPSLLGAMLADVDYVLMGAGIPREIPGVLDQLSRLEDTKLTLNVADAGTSEYHASIDPRAFVASGCESLKRPQFLAIIASTTLALTLARKCTSKIDGFVVEGFTAGGHNAPPRGGANIDELGQPVYGPRDYPDIEQIKGLGLPFWLAGSFGSRDKLQEAQQLGAVGIQVGTAFAFSDESGIAPEIKSGVIARALGGDGKVLTDAYASPTGFPFKVLDVPGSLSDPDIYEERERTCDLGYLRQMYVREDGKMGFRCSAEPVEDYVAKGGDEAETQGKKCLCNGLVATVGLGQERHRGEAEPPLITAGDDIEFLARFTRGHTSYSVADVLDVLLDRAAAPVS